MKHIKELDVLRAFAVLFVMLSHWIPEGNILYRFTWVLSGVNIFFVLSGFLITGILINNKLSAEKNKIGTGTLFKNFIARRTLRIFPIYYLYVGIVYLLGSSTQTDIRQDLFYYLTYTSNFHFYTIDRWDGMLSHLWSLAVEEQFYLVWPWLILLLPKRWILPSILLFIVIGITTSQLPDGKPLYLILTHTCFHAFGFGALLAWVNIFNKPLLIRSYGILTIAAVLAFSLQLVQAINGMELRFPDDRTLTSIFTMWAIASILLEKHKRYTFFNLLLSNRLLIFIGKISYGIYLYHLIIPLYSKPLLSYVNKGLPAFTAPYTLYIVILENFLLVVLLSWLSWIVVEKPILRLKKYFEVRSGTAANQQHPTEKTPVIAVPESSAPL